MNDEPDPSRGIRGPMSELYDVFIDWNSRLSREVPALQRRLDAVGARRVLDVGCGTGRHVGALRALGYEVHGADASEEMLARAEEHLGGANGLHAWTMGEREPRSLEEQEPFDAVICLGNAWPALVDDEAARAAVESFARLVRPGGLLLIALKALGVREAGDQPYMPLMRRTHMGRTLFFVRFVDFAVADGLDGARRCDLHMAILEGEAAMPLRALSHGATRMRAWTPDELHGWCLDRGLEGVEISGPLPAPAGPPTGEDVVVSARFAGR